MRRRGYPPFSSWGDTPPTFSFSSYNGQEWSRNIFNILYARLGRVQFRDADIHIYIYIQIYYIYTYIHVYVDYRDIQYNIMYILMYTAKQIITRHSFSRLNDLAAIFQFIEINIMVQEVILWFRKVILWFIKVILQFRKLYYGSLN